MNELRPDSIFGVIRRVAGPPRHDAVTGRQRSRAGGASRRPSTNCAGRSCSEDDDFTSKARCSMYAPESRPDQGAIVRKSTLNLPTKPLQVSWAPSVTRRPARHHEGIHRHRYGRIDGVRVGEIPDPDCTR